MPELCTFTAREEDSLILVHTVPEAYTFLAGHSPYKADTKWS